MLVVVYAAASTSLARARRRAWLFGSRPFALWMAGGWS